jgi:cell division protein FtsA
VRSEIVRSGYWDHIAAGVVLTGGTTNLDGLPDLAEAVLGFPARAGQPSNVGGLADVVRSPEYSTGVGLVLYGANRSADITRPVEVAPDRGMWGRMRSWIGEMF